MELWLYQWMNPVTVLSELKKITDNGEEAENSQISSDLTPSAGSSVTGEVIPADSAGVEKAKENKWHFH